MQDCRLSDTLMANRDKFSLNKCLKNNFKEKNTQYSLYVSGRKSYVCLGFYMTGYYIRDLDVGQMFN